MIHFLLLLLLTSCSALKVAYLPRYTYNEEAPLPLKVGEVSLTIADDTSTCFESGLAKSLRLWTKKRFKFVGEGHMHILIKTRPITPELANMPGLASRAVIAEVTIYGSKPYVSVRLEIELYRTNNKFGSDHSQVTSEAWAEYMTNFVNSFDKQVLLGLKKYAPKLFVLKQGAQKGNS